MSFSKYRQHKIYPTEFPESWASGWGEDEYGIWMEFTYKGIVQRFRWCEPGTFLMGSPEGEPERGEDEVQHVVTLTRGFWIADTSVTQALWKEVMGYNPSSFQGNSYPVESISWNDTQTFIYQMNDFKPELKLFLPSEAQWEYACRAGSQTPFYWGGSINSNLANFDGTASFDNGELSNFLGETVDVKTYSPNAWGIYQMHGNVRNWCQDCYTDYRVLPQVDPLGKTGSERVLRGGAWISHGRFCRSASRVRYTPDSRFNFVGLRLVRAN